MSKLQNNHNVTCPNTFSKETMDIQVDESTAYVRIACKSECIAEEIMKQLTYRRNGNDGKHNPVCIDPDCEDCK